MYYTTREKGICCYETISSKNFHTAYLKGIILLKSVYNKEKTPPVKRV